MLILYLRINRVHPWYNLYAKIISKTIKTRVLFFVYFFFSTRINRVYPWFNLYVKIISKSIKTCQNFLYLLHSNILNTCGTPVRFPPREYFNFPVRPETTVPTGCPSCNRMLHLTSSRLAVPKRSNCVEPYELI